MEMAHEICVYLETTKQAFENAIRRNGAVGGSTNAVIHLLARLRDASA